MDGARSLPRLLPLLALALPALCGGQAQHLITQLEFYQTSLSTAADSSEFLFDFDGDEIFHVERGETRWRLPEFGDFAAFEAQGALQNLDIDRQNLENSRRANNDSRVQAVPPLPSLFAKRAVQWDEPNVLVCCARQLWPPALGLRWLRNGAEVGDAALETPFYADRDNTFRKFSYLTFVPRPGDSYECVVEHEALPEPKKILWEPQVQSAPSEAMETLLCALGLAAGTAGVGAGTALFVRALRLGRDRRGAL